MGVHINAQSRWYNSKKNIVGLVAKGFTQAHGMYYFETFSPIGKLNCDKSNNVIGKKKKKNHSHCIKWDVKNAFRYRDLKEGSPTKLCNKRRRQCLSTQEVFIWAKAVTSSIV